MIFEELMHDYLDGTLSDADQTELFHIVSVSPEKRTEFNEYVGIRSAIVKDRMAQVVPKGLEQAVLAAASTSVSPGVVSVAQGSGAIAEGAFALNKIMSVLLVAGGLTVGGILGYILAEKNTSSASASIAGNSPAAIIHDQQSAPSVNSGSNAMNHIVEMHSHAPRAVSHSTHISAQDQSGANNATMNNVVAEGWQPGTANNAMSVEGTKLPQNTIEKLLFTANVPVSHAVPVVVSTQGTEHITGLMPHNGASHESWRPQMPVQEPNTEDDAAEYQLELQAGGASLFPKFTSSNLTPAPLINYTNLRFGMNIWDGAMLGISVGQSTYSLEYSSQTSALTTATYLQYSNLWYTGIYLQQSLASVLGLTPKATVELAGTNIGVLGNVQAGVSYPLVKGIYADINGVVSGLMYRHAGAWLGSQKIGILFGIGTEF